MDRSILKPLLPSDLSVQLRSIRLITLEVAESALGADNGATTVIGSATVSEPPRPSETPTVKELSPISALPGVPLKLPLDATDSHAGPLVLANVSGSASASLALPAMLPLYASPWVALVLTIGSLVNAGGLFVPLPPPARKLATIGAVDRRFERCRAYPKSRWESRCREHPDWNNAARADNRANTHVRHDGAKRALT